MDIAPLKYPLVSIIITSYNYARYLRHAIDSALNQTYLHIELVVVDDESTDDSRRIIASYGNKVVPVLKENGGHPSAINAGFAASRGELISFLDADDVFHHEKIALVVKAWRAMPAASVVYHQMQGIDAQGEALWNGKPWPRFVHRGDIAARVERSGGWWAWPSTSGLSFPRSYLERVLPMPEEEFDYGSRGGVDAYMAGLAPFRGPVMGIRRPLTQYRIHGENHSLLDSATEQALCRRKIAFLSTEFTVVKKTVEEWRGSAVAMSLRDNYLHQWYCRGAGEAVTFLQVMSTMMKCPLLPLSGRVREARRILQSEFQPRS